MKVGVRGGKQFPDGNILIFNFEKLILFQVLYPEEENTWGNAMFLSPWWFKHAWSHNAFSLFKGQLVPWTERLLRSSTVLIPSGWLFDLVCDLVCACYFPNPFVCRYAGNNQSELSHIPTIWEQGGVDQRRHFVVICCNNFRFYNRDFLGRRGKHDWAAPHPGFHSRISFIRTTNSATTRSRVRTVHWWDSLHTVAFLPSFETGTSISYSGSLLQAERSSGLHWHIFQAGREEDWKAEESSHAVSWYLLLKSTWIHRKKTHLWWVSNEQEEWIFTR